MGDSDIVKDFLAESYENLDQLDRELVALEKDPGNRDSLASVFRTIHTIKGTCGFLGPVYRPRGASRWPGYRDPERALHVINQVRRILHAH